MRRSFYARITPVGGPRPAHPIELPEGGDEHPSHPIVIIPPSEPGKPPLVIWGGPYDPPHPEHPIVLPPIIWPQPPDGGPPIIIDPPHPEHPIVLPPLPPVDDAHPEHPIVIPLPPEVWPGPGEPPIIIVPPDPPAERPIDWHTGWTEDTGWVIVGVPSGPHPAPSKRRK